MPQKALQQAYNDAPADQKAYIADITTAYMVTGTHNNKMAQRNVHTHTYDTNDKVKRKDVEEAMANLAENEDFQRYLENPTDNIDALNNLEGNADADLVLGVFSYAAGHLMQTKKNSDFRKLMGLNNNNARVDHPDFNKALGAITEQLEAGTLHRYMTAGSFNAAGNAAQNDTRADIQVMNLVADGGLTQREVRNIAKN